MHQETPDLAIVYIGHVTKLISPMYCIEDVPRRKLVIRMFPYNDTHCIDYIHTSNNNDQKESFLLKQDRSARYVNASGPVV